MHTSADVVKFPEEELATESVLPKFDFPDSVRNRNVITANKFEMGAYLGWNTTEPILNQGKYGLNVGYHWSETSSLILNYTLYLPGLNTTYTDGLDQTYNLDFGRSPKIKSSSYLNYEWKIYYGKISVTKQGVINVSVYPILGAGMTAYEHKNYFGVNGGIGQKFYFTKSFALRADIKMQIAQQPSPFLGGDPLQPAGTTKSVKRDGLMPSPSDFADKWRVSTIIDVGGSFIF